VRTTAAGLRAEARRLGSSIAALQIVKSRSGDSYVSTLSSSKLKKAGLSANLCSSRLNLRSRVP
jgi:hypothetical protein